MTKLEEVARAICVARDRPPENWEWYEEAARAAIAALREPTEAMKDAGSDPHFDIHWCVHADGRPCEVDDVWKAMIDALLAEGAPTEGTKP